MNKSVNSEKRINYYLTLDVIPGVSQNEIHHAYKRAKMTYTQDSLASYSLIEEENSDQIMAEIEEAYEVLGHPSKRREYDLKMGFGTWSDEDEVRKALKRELSRPTVTSDGPDSINWPNHLSRDEDPLSSISYGEGGDGNVGGMEDTRGPFEQSLEAGVDVAEAEDKSRGEDRYENRGAQAQENETPRMRVVDGPAPSFESEDDDDEMHFEANPEFEQQIRDCVELSGEFLKAVRIYRKLSIEQLASCTKLSNARIVGMEEEEVDGYLLPVYLRGHVAIVCQVLNMPEPEKLAKSYIERLREAGKLPSPSL